MKKCPPKKSDAQTRKAKGAVVIAVVVKKKPAGKK